VSLGEGCESVFQFEARREKEAGKEMRKTGASKREGRKKGEKLKLM